MSIASYLATGVPRKRPTIWCGARICIEDARIDFRKVPAICETYLGLRHGPLCYVDGQTLAVRFLSCDPILRSYELDLVSELNSKKLGLMKLIVGDNIPTECALKNDVLIECPGLSALGDESAPMIDVLCGQLLAFFRCRKEGFHPDAPSQNGAINRVVPPFRIHRQTKVEPTRM